MELLPTVALPQTEWDAVEILEKLRWKRGFRCRCGYRKHYRLKKRARVFVCKACSHQASVTAGTALHRTRVPLSAWFVAASMISQPGGCSAAALQRAIGTCYQTAWRLLHRLREAMQGPHVHLNGTPILYSIGIWCQKPGREQVGGGIAWVWAASDGEHFVSRYTANQTGGQVLAAQHSDSQDVATARRGPAYEHLRWISIQTHVTHMAVSQKWLARYLQEIDFRRNFLKDSQTAQASVLTTALNRKSHSFAQIVPRLWCPPTHDLEGPFLGPDVLLNRVAPPAPLGPGLRRRDIPRVRESRQPRPT